MLPQFNKAKGLSDIISSKMKNLSEYKKMAEGGEVSKEKEYDELELISAELLHAISERDVKLFAQVLKDFIACADAAPHEEYESKDSEEKKGPGALLISGEI